jgi:hypothetical protein
VTVEFYDGAATHPMVTVEGVPPPVDAMISIRRPSLRANVTLEKP